MACTSPHLGVSWFVQVEGEQKPICLSFPSLLFTAVPQREENNATTDFLERGGGELGYGRLQVFRDEIF